MVLSSSEILILGACVRPCVAIAAAAGYQVTGIDLFNDADTQAASNASIKADHYPKDLFGHAESSKANYWLYTGCLENYPEQIAQLANKKTLLGNNQNVIRKCRSPEFISELAIDAEWHYPDAAIADASRTNNEFQSWISKPRLSAAGQSVQVWHSIPPATSERIAQLYIPGPTFGAACISNGSETQVLGITRHLRMTRRLGVTRFQYCGSVGPLPLSDTLNAAISTMASEIASECGIVGLFGLDLKIQNNQIWLLEINPRFTASMDLLRDGTGENLIQQHIDACRNKPLIPIQHSKKLSAIQTRAILFAKSPTRFNPTCNQWDFIADIPAHNTTLDIGSPICSIYGRGKTASESVRHAMYNLNRLESTLTVEDVE